MEQKDPERPLTRKQASAFLTERGFPVAPKTLDKYACRGGGPRYTLFGRRTLYSPSDLLTWVASRCQTIRHTSELGVPHAEPT
jgi:hypothetical protein